MRRGRPSASSQEVSTKEVSTLQESYAEPQVATRPWVVSLLSNLAAFTMDVAKGLLMVLVGAEVLLLCFIIALIFTSAEAALRVVLP